MTRSAHCYLHLVERWVITTNTTGLFRICTHVAKTKIPDRDVIISISIIVLIEIIEKIEWFDTISKYLVTIRYSYNCRESFLTFIFKGRIDMEIMTFWYSVYNCRRINMIKLWWSCLWCFILLLTLPNFVGWSNFTCSSLCDILQIHSWPVVFFSTFCTLCLNSY